MYKAFEESRLTTGEGAAGEAAVSVGPGFVGKVASMNEVFDYGTGVPYTHEDLEALFRGEVTRQKSRPNCSICPWFDLTSCELCRGPITCVKWTECGKCCPLTGRTSLVDFETCPQFKADPIMCQ